MPTRLSVTAVFIEEDRRGETQSRKSPHGIRVDAIVGPRAVRRDNGRCRFERSEAQRPEDGSLFPLRLQAKPAGAAPEAVPARCFGYFQRN